MIKFEISSFDRNRKKKGNMNHILISFFFQNSFSVFSLFFFFWIEMIIERDHFLIFARDSSEMISDDETRKSNTPVLPRFNTPSLISSSFDVRYYSKGNKD